MMLPNNDSIIDCTDEVLDGNLDDPNLMRLFQSTQWCLKDYEGGKVWENKHLY